MRARRSRTKVGAIVALFAVLGWIGVEMLFLRGDVLQSRRIIAGQSATFEIRDVGETLTVDVSARSSSDGPRFGIEIIGPEGDAIASRTPLRKRSSVTVDFVPEVPGTYRVKTSGLMSVSSLRVELLTEDRRVLLKLLSRF